ncbi:hypothetical protein LCGC14_1210250 [marine sediment metagenome]|uniref:DNA topoisomerase type IA zn finger domain-containing protein n=1 Tax=marine sediment metagenome TaxID=412755 RepID=A0A0F9PIW1_9ZZZZ
MGDSVECPKCQGTMRIKGALWVCTNNPWCGYQREMLKPVLSQAELLKENAQLKEWVKQLETILRTHRIKI